MIEDKELEKAVKEVKEEIEVQLKSKLRKVKWEELDGLLTRIGYVNRPRPIPPKLGIRKDGKTEPLPNYYLYEEKQDLTEEELMEKLKENIKIYGD